MVDENKFLDVITVIKKYRKNGDSFESIKNKINDPNFNGVISFLNWPEDTLEHWIELVEYVGDKESELQRLQEATTKAMVIGENTTNNLKIPIDDFSNWQLYRKKLIENKFANVDTIEIECVNILNQLSINTTPDSPIKGMVVGYVQSGKTANMAGLMSMAADYDWNLFIILSGTIENLRVQTKNRLFNDLNNNYSKDVWMTHNHLAPNIVELEQFNPKCKTLTVCLKNPTRLRKLLNWINSDLDRKKSLRILLIDDEADQASINTSRKDSKRTIINDLIMKIVNCKDIDGNVVGEYGAMNYVQYTATPYANFLSENTYDSLYPKDFVILLTPSNEYFGPHVIYGDNDQYPGLGIVDTSEDVYEASKKYIAHPEGDVPECLKNAVAWFITSVCVARYWNRKEPISMLVHTTQFVDGHTKLAKAVLRCLEDKTDLFDRCERIYSKKISELTKEDFYSRFKQYGLDPKTVNDYPDYSKIKDSVIELISMKPQHIGLNEDDKIVYKRGIHICVDNGKGDDFGLSDDEEERIIKRIVYPKGKDKPDYATAFIVIGGNTLSRGLTIEGLVSTYFGRASGTGDTLMQMGRWFGYRKGYELLPRMWMSKETLHDFEIVSEADHSLREFIKENYDKYTPTELPPMVRAFPKVGHLRSMTSPSKSINAIETGYDFSGCIFQTTVFDKEPTILKHNEHVTKEFISNYKDRVKQSLISSAKIIRGIPTSDVCDNLISKLIYNDRLKPFKELENLIEWIKKRNTKDWNIILGTRSDGNVGSWKICEGLSINKIERAVKHETKNELSINKTLASPLDRFSDIDPKDYRSNEDDYKILLKKKEVGKLRAHCGISDTPILIIYCVSVNPSTGPMDVIGIAIQMPGVKSEKDVQWYLQLPPRETT